MIRFIFKNLFIHLLVLILVDLPSPTVMPFLGGVVFAAEVEEGTLEHKLELYNMLVSNPNFPENLSEGPGKETLDDVQKFIANSSNRTALATGPGRELLGMHNKLTRYVAIKDTFDDCLTSQDPHYTKGLPERLLSASLSVDNSVVPCDRGLFEAESLETLLGDIKGVVDQESSGRAQDFHDFQGEMNLQGLKNSAKTYLGLEYTYNKTFGGDSDELPENLSQPIVDRICQKSTRTIRTNTSTSYKCSEKERNEISDSLRREYRKLKANDTQRYDISEARADVLRRVEEINEVIQENEFDTQDDWGEDGIDFSTEKSQASHRNYVEKYMAVASEGPGLLLWTDEIGEERKDTDSNALFGLINGGFDPSTRRYRPHSTRISDTTIQRAIDEAKERVLEQSEYLIDVNNDRKSEWGQFVTRPIANANRARSNGSSRPNYGRVVENRKESLKDMVRKNPVIAGQVLMQSPEYAKEACDVINGVIQDTRDGEEWSWGDVFLYGGMIVGVGLLAATGVGLLALGVGAGMAAGGLASAATVYAASSAILTTATYAGLALGVAEMAYFGPKWASSSRERNEMLNAYLAGGGDEASAGEYLEKLAEFEDARLNFGLAGVFTIFDIGAIRAITRTLSSGEKVAVLDRAKEMMNFITGTRARSRLIKEATALMGDAGRPQVRKVMRMLLKHDNYREILEHITSLTPQKAKEVLENGFKVCDELCP